jgi:hypothetical protein
MVSQPLTLGTQKLQHLTAQARTTELTRGHPAASSDHCQTLLPRDADKSTLAQAWGHLAQCPKPG